MLRIPKLVVLNLTTDCNMRCEYCYAEAGERNNDYMTFDIAIKTIEELRRINNNNKIKVLFHGGEPLMVYDVIKKIIEYYKEKELSSQIDYYIQTNCILLTEDKIKYFKENDVKISISIDGNNEKTNKCRILKNKNNSIKIINETIKLLKHNNIKINALSVLNKNNYLNTDEIIDFFVENNIYDFSFNYFIKGGRGNKNSHLSLTGEELAIATKKIIKKIIDYRKKGIIINEKNIYYLLKMVIEEKKAYMCSNSPCGAGLNIFGITPKGDIYPCDDLSGVEEFCLGNIMKNNLEKILESKTINYFANCNYQNIKECCNCQYKKSCGAGCCSRKYYENKSIYSKDPICDFYKIMIPYIKNEMKNNNDLIEFYAKL